MCGRGLKSIALCLLVLLLAQFSLFSQEKKFFITETQLNQLEETLTTQQQQLENQQIQLQKASDLIERLNLELEQQKTLLKKYETSNLWSEIKVGGICFTVGVGVGCLTYVIWRAQQ